MSELLKYLNEPSRVDPSIMKNYGCYQYSNENKTNRALELLNKFNNEFEENEKCDKLKKKMNMINANVPFKNYQRLNAKWLNNNCLNGDSILFSNDMRTVMFYPNKSYGACGVKSDLVLKRNAYSYWQVTIGPDRLYGTSIMVGIGTNKAKLSSIGYINLLGSDQFSWGLSHKGILWHSNNSKLYCTQLIGNNNNNNCVKIGCLYDGYRKTLSYFINDVYMGIAFDNVDNVRSCGNRNEQTDTGLYPMVSSTVSQSIIKFDFFYQTFPSLQDICRTNVTKNETLFNSIKLEYPYLPKFIIEYLEN